MQGNIYLPMRHLLVFVCKRHEVFKAKTKRVNFDAAASDVNLILRSALHVSDRSGIITRLKSLSGQTLEQKLGKIIDLDCSLDKHPSDASGHGEVDDESGEV